MKKNVADQLSRRLRRAATAIVASGVMAAAAAHANASNNLVLIPPTDLPALARQAGEAMFLHDAIDGRTILYIEQDQGARLAAFDVTDPVHIKGERSVRLEASGPFDFVSPLGNQAELVRFRQGHEDAVLDLPRVKDPQLKTVQGLTLRGPITGLSNDGFTVAGEASGVPPARDYQVVDAVNLRELNRVFDVKQVRAEITKADTGTTFMLTEDGLYVIRRPAVESIHQLMTIPPN
jgi:hypothetical protein